MTRTMKASEFKAKCLRLIDEIAASGSDIVITKRGKAVARVTAAVTHDRDQPSLFGALKGKIEIVAPDDDLSTWDEETSRSFERRLTQLDARR